MAWLPSQKKSSCLSWPGPILGWTSVKECTSQLKGRHWTEWLKHDPPKKSSQLITCFLVLVSKATLCLHLLTSDATPNSPNRSQSPYMFTCCLFLLFNVTSVRFLPYIILFKAFFLSAQAPKDLINYRDIWLKRLFQVFRSMIMTLTMNVIQDMKHGFYYDPRPFT